MVWVEESISLGKGENRFKPENELEVERLPAAVSVDCHRRNTRDKREISNDHEPLSLPQARRRGTWQWRRHGGRNDPRRWPGRKRKEESRQYLSENEKLNRNQSRERRRQSRLKRRGSEVAEPE